MGGKLQESSTAGMVAEGERHSVRTGVQRDEEPPAEFAFEACPVLPPL
jgi:hypothetical protein